MGLYDNAWPHVYEEIRRFYPVWYRDVLEMDAIWRAQGVELDGVRATVEALIDNGYIMTADLHTIASLEAFLHINPSPGQTLQERRQVVATYVRGQDHIGAPEIKSIAGAFTSGVVDVEFALGIISVMVSHPVEEAFNLEACKELLLSRIPAHLALTLVEVISTMYPAIAHVVAGLGKGYSETALPEVSKKFNWRRPVNITPWLGRGYSQTCLPEIPKNYQHRAPLVVAAQMGKGYSQTSLSEVPKNYGLHQIAAVAPRLGAGYTQIVLPETPKNYGFTAAVYTVGAFSTYTSTALPAVE